MSTADDPRCPECGGPIGQTATYCMHCSADLTDERAAADLNDDGAWDRTTTQPPASQPDGSPVERGRLLAPDSLLDNTLTVVVGVVGGLVVGIVGTGVLLAATGSPWALAFGLLAWLGATAYLVRRRTVQGAIATTGYAVAIVLLLVPLIAISPVVPVEGGLEGRGGAFIGLVVLVAVPAMIAAGIGWVASQFVPADERGSEG